MWLELLIVFAAGVFVGYKYPRQVEQAIEKAKNLYNDLKNMITKKGAS
jgi:hypothetical protein